MLGQTNFQARTRGFSRFDEDELVLVADDHFALDTRHVRGDVFVLCHLKSSNARAHKIHLH